MSVCGRCEGHGYRGVKALFDGDLNDINARDDWRVISPSIAVYLGESKLRPEEHPLYRGCEIATGTLTTYERTAINALSHMTGRPGYGTP